MHHEPIHICVPGSPDDPRIEGLSLEGVVIHRVPYLHPDDVVTFADGLRVTSPSRTLIDLAEVFSIDELRESFILADLQGLLDLHDLAAARARVEWRSSLETFDAVFDEFFDAAGG